MKFKINVMSAYKIDIDIHNTPEQEIFVSFQCNVLSVPFVDRDDILFKSQVIEFNGKTRTEIPITCISSIQDQRIFNKVNKLQKGNKIEITGNLIKNNKDEIVVLIIYLVYVNVNNFSSDKKDLTKLPWLNSFDVSKKKIADQKESTDLPDFIANLHKKPEIINVEDNVDDITEGDNNSFIYY